MAFLSAHRAGSPRRRPADRRRQPVEARHRRPAPQRAARPPLPPPLPKPATDRVRRNGLTGLGPALTTQLRLAEPSPETRTAMASEIREAHCGRVPGEMIGG